MKTPRELYDEEHGERAPSLRGGKAAARQQQFDQERGKAPSAGEGESPDRPCAEEEKGKGE